MNRHNKTNRIRSTLCASAALVALLTTFASIDVLARHYGLVAQVTTLEKPVVYAAK